MKTAILTTLLLIGMLAPAATVLAGPVDAIVACAQSVASPDGQTERVRNVDTGVDVIHQNDPCLD